MNEPIESGLPASARLSDLEVAKRVSAGDTPLFEVLMRRHNQRVYRIVRSILRDETECEEAMQQAWISAWRALAGFEGRASFLTWITSIAIREAHRRGARLRSVSGRMEELPHALEADELGPEDDAMRSQLGSAIEREIDALPEIYRTTIVLREIEGLSTSETAAALKISEDTVKQRLRRAKSSLRTGLERRASGEMRGLYPFHDPRCDRIVSAVLEQIGAESSQGN
jgi:RNA polymerase sigma-70 factor, ECF subfamily